jgi:hypothetical protein
VFIGLLVNAVDRVLADGHQLVGERRSLGPLGVTHQVEQFSVAALSEHMFDSARRWRRLRLVDQPPVDENATWDNR